MNRRIILLSLILLLLLTPVAHAQRAEGRLASPAGVRAVGGGAPARTTIQDGGFENSYVIEALSVNDAWKADSSAFGSPICIDESCNVDPAFAGPHNGSDWVYFGHTSAAETGFIEQKVVIPATSDVQLTYFVWHSFAFVSPTMTVSVDSQLVDTLPAGVTPDYVERVVDLTPFADGKTHKIRFSYSKPAGGYADLNLDSVALYKGESVSPYDHSFEDNSEMWTVNNGTGDKVKCNTKTKTISYQFDCAFRFKGGPGEKSKLKQLFSMLRDAPPAPGRAPAHFAIYLGAFVNGPASLRGTMTLKLTMSDDSVIKRKVSLKGKGKYKWVQTPAVRLKSELSIIAIMIEFKHTSTSGKTYIDAVEIFEAADYS